MVIPFLYRLLAAAVMAPARFGRAAFMFQLGDELGALFEQRRQVLIAARDRSRISADLFVQLCKLFFQIGAHTTIRSTNSLTGVCSSRFWSLQSSRMVFCCCDGKRRARLRSNFSTRCGMPSLRRRLWPIGYSTTTSGSVVPSLNSTVSALAIERLSGSR